MTMTHCEWGANGVALLRPRVAVLVIVDVLSFSTAVDIATARGAEVVPFPSGDRHAAAVAAREAGALLGAPRHPAGDRPSLSPRTLCNLATGTRILLPSPNGSRLSVMASPGHVVAGCLRNANAVAQAALRLADGGEIGVVPAGERWPDGSLRPAIEDWLSAGMIVDALPLPASAEARVARDAYRAACGDLPDIIRGSLSGQELLADGFAEDVALALEANTSANVPTLIDGTYIGSFSG